MTQPTIFFVGRPDEVAHHAAPFRERLNVQISETSVVLERARPGDLAIFYSEHFDRFRDCCQQLKNRNVATLYLIDGILEWRNAWDNRDNEVACPYAMRPVLAHKVACIGASQVRVLDSWGNVGKTEVVGIPRFDRLAVRPPIERSREEFRILVMTAKTPGFTAEQLTKVKSGLRDLKQWHARNSVLDGRTTKMTWRLTGGLAAEIGVENSLDDLAGGELESVLAESDAVITTSSTALVESMLLDRPVALLDYHNCPHYVSAGWTIGGPEEIDAVISSMVERPETRMLFQRQQLADALANQGNATDRVVELVEAMVEIAGVQVAQNRSLEFRSVEFSTIEFPAKILTPSDAPIVPFDHQKVYPTAREFSEQDRSVLQVELSHARREVAHLHDELAQLKSELDQAHQIFETIEKHPIAGPVVRIRQKMIDLMAVIRKHRSQPEPDRPESGGQRDNSPANSSSN